MQGSSISLISHLRVHNGAVSALGESERPAIVSVRVMTKRKECWEVFNCQRADCPAYHSEQQACWLVSGTLCRGEIAGECLEKIGSCLRCEVLKANMDPESMQDTIGVLDEQFTKYRNTVDRQDKELKAISMEMALGLSEVFEALKEIASGNPDIRVPEGSPLDLIAKLKHLVNLTAENLSQIVNLSHEFAIGLAEHFDVLLRVSEGQLTARVLGRSQVELLESLRHVTNKMIESVSREITERKRAESALRASENELRESEERYHALFDYSPNSSFVLEPKTFKILYVNTRCLEIYGYQRDELVGRSFLDLGTSEFSDGIFSGKEDGIETRYDVYTRVAHRKKDGSPFFVNVYVCCGKRSPKFGMIAVTVDITESLVKEAQLIQASKMSTLGEMATGVAHELNQPLSAIQIGTDFFRNMINQGQAIPADELRLVSEQMAQQVGRAVGIINHLRQFGRTGRVEREKININEPLEGVFAFLRQQLKARGIKFISELDDNLPCILADSNRLEQVFIDIIVNARDAIEEKRRRALETGVESLLTVRSFRAGGCVVVSISDTGIGIPEEIRDKIFDPFFTTKRVGEGTGLGLSISYRIVKEYDGVIEVESELGKGTTFRISFPACEES
jgi:PAS domain S-box-containing protein